MVISKEGKILIENVFIKQKVMVRADFLVSAEKLDERRFRQLDYVLI